MVTESTLLIVKPDGVRRRLVGEVLRRVEAKGLAIDELKLFTIERTVAEEHYGEHRDKPFFDELVTLDRPVIEDGYVTLPEGPGIGSDLDLDIARRHARPGEPFFGEPAVP